MNQPANSSIYREVLLDHFHNPRGKAEFDDTDRVGRGSNPQCGDEVEIAINVCEHGYARIRFKGRGCSVCLASASIMVSALSGLALADLKREYAEAVAWLTSECKAEPSDVEISALDVVRSHPARSKCVLLAWRALGDLINGIE